jgi:hypothetical protein
LRNAPAPHRPAATAALLAAIVYYGCNQRTSMHIKLVFQKYPAKI